MEPRALKGIFAGEGPAPLFGPSPFVSHTFTNYAENIPKLDTES